jgi:hypothetical protein
MVKTGDIYSIYDERMARIKNMTKQEREKAKMIEKDLKQTLKFTSKENKWSYKDLTIFKVESGFFFEVMISYNRLEKSIETRMAFKPYSLDDLFWDIFDMPENKNQPLSFRCFGAFTVSAFKIIEWNVKIENDEIDFGNICRQIINESQQNINNVLLKVYNLNTYITYLKEKYSGSVIDINLELILANIQMGNIEEALSITNSRLEIGDSGKFLAADSENTLKGIYDYVKKYCESVLNSRSYLSDKQKTDKQK